MKIKYSIIMSLGFKEIFEHDQIYFNEFGFDYSRIEKYLTKKIYLNWDKETQLCKLIRLDNLRDMNIVGEIYIKSLDELRLLIKFYEN